MQSIAATIWRIALAIPADLGEGRVWQSWGTRVAEFCLHPDKLESMLNEINRHRALTDDEVDMLEALVYRGHRPTGTNFRWKPDHDAALVEASRNRGGIKQFADNHGITLNSGIQRLRRIRATG